MNENLKPLIIDLIAAAVTDSVVLPTEISDKEIENLYKLSEFHDLSYAVGLALNKIGLVTREKYKEFFEKPMLYTAYRSIKIKHELNEIQKALEKAGIEFVCLKGAVLRELYPDPNVRTSCDIDVLIREEDLTKAAKTLESELGYLVSSKKDYHDLSLYSKSGVHLELHFSLKENLKNVDKLLERAWEYVSPKENGKFARILDAEFFVFYHLAHMAYHFLHGGCGIKPFLDLYIIRKNMPYNEDRVIEYCRECGIEKFYSSVLDLVCVWFENKAHTGVTKQMESYVISGGVYGSFENRIAVQQSVKGGKGGYLFSKIFVSYDVLKAHYPILEKRRWLMPVMQVRRWFRLIFCGHSKRVVKELKQNSKASQQDIELTKTFLDNIGLSLNE